MDLKQFNASATNWRAELRKNSQKTTAVLCTFLGIYLAVGLIVDVFVLQNIKPNLSLSQAIQSLLTFQQFPLATVIMLIIACLSLLITFVLHDKIILMGTEAHEIKPHNTQSLQEEQLYNVVSEMQIAAGLRYMPKVYLIEADYMNAFASGYSEKSAIVAITRGLLEKLDRAELQAVMAHELSHIRHLDIKLTLTVAVLSNLLLMVIDFLFYQVIYQRDEKNNNQFALVIMILRYVLPLITILLTLFLSRTREYMADAGAVELMRDNEPMARALLKISQDHEQHADQYQRAYGKTAHEQVRQAAYIFDPSDINPMKSLTQLFSTHPTVLDRLKAIGFKKDRP